MCRDGRGVAQDDGEAVTWFRRAAEQGNASGQFNLGLMYENGRGVRTGVASGWRSDMGPGVGFWLLGSTKMMLARLCGLGRRRRRRRRARATPSFRNRTSPATKQADRNSHRAGGVRHSVIVRREFDGLSVLAQVVRPTPSASASRVRTDTGNAPSGAGEDRRRTVPAGP